MSPKIAVAAVAFDDQDRVLLAKRGREPAMGRWSVPGGKVELGETLAQACAREMLEETGLDVRVGERVAVVERIGQDESGGVSYHYVIHDYLVEIIGGTLAAASDASEVGWFTLGELDSMPVTDGLEQVLKQAQALRNTL